MLKKMIVVIFLLSASLFVYAGHYSERHQYYTDFVDSALGNRLNNNSDNDSADDAQGAVELLSISSNNLLRADGNEQPEINGNNQCNAMCCCAPQCNPCETFHYLVARAAQAHPCEYMHSLTMYGFNRTLIALKLIDINAVDERGRTHLTVAATRGDIAMVDALIAAGAHVNAVDYDGHTALMNAALIGHTEVVDILIAAGAQIDVVDYYHDRTALWFAINHSNIDVMHALIVARAHIDVHDTRGSEALKKAVFHRDRAMVHSLLVAGAHVNTRDKILATNFQSPSRTTANQGHTAVVEALLAAGANSLYSGLIDAEASSNLYSNLNTAAANGHAGVVEELLAARAHPDPYPNMTTELDLWTPLIHAAIHNNIVIVKMLINAGTRIDRVNQKGETALFFAARNRHAETVELLLASGANLRIINKKGETALLLAAKGRDGDVVSQMIIDEYHRRLLRPCPIAGELIVKNSHVLMERILPVECGQEVASLLSKQNILALRLVSTHCLLYAQHEFEKIKNERTVKLKKNLIEDIKSAISTPKRWRGPISTKIFNESLERELVIAESINVATALGAHAQQPINVEIPQKLDEIDQPSSQELQARRIPALYKNNSEDSGANVGEKK